MDANILCTFLSKRIPPEQFQLHGLDIHWMSEDYDNVENNTIVSDVINNYPVLEIAYLTEQQTIKDAQEALQAAKQRALVDNLPSWTQVDTAINNIANLADAKAFIKKLTRVVYLDLKNSVD